MRGHVVKRGKSWAVVVELPRDPETGKRRQRWHSGYRTRKEAESARVKILASLDRGEYVEPSKLTLGAFLSDKWLPAISVRSSTRASYESMVTNHVVPRIGGVVLQRLTPDALNAFYRGLLADGRKDGAGLSPKSVRNVHVVVRKALSDAVRWGYLARNVAALAEPPKLRASVRATMRTWTAAELRTFLEYARGDDFYPCLYLAASTGMRRGELLGLQWIDVDLDGASLSVLHTLVSVDYKVESSEPKTPRARRTIDLDTATAAVLREHRKSQLEQRMMMGAGYGDAGLVFARADGSLIHPQALSDRFDRLVSGSGLPRIRLHDLRHTHATMALKAGVPVKVVSERLGHASVAFTMDVYQHVLPGMQREAAELVAGLIFESK